MLPAPVPELPQIEEDVPGTPPPGALPEEAVTQAEPDPATMPAPVEAIEEAPVAPAPADQPSTFVMTPAERSALEHRLARLAQDAARNSQSTIQWEHNGRQFSAALVMQKASDGIEFDRVIAEVSAEDQGRQVTTHIRLKRLSFSHFTQMIDRWDPSVQMHDDEIIGRFHVNSSFNLLYDRSNTPRFIGKVTTAPCRSVFIVQSIKLFLQFVEGPSSKSRRSSSVGGRTGSPAPSGQPTLYTIIVRPKA